ncbi:hypothetical protein [Methylocystis parvus]|uniref:VrrB protein n=1 Tax=Methylocystis parvus TaxID=134 RepID=A0A6B8MCR9_9HYPH|nr:hypothetical protein [Methylocystis parvus]QGM99113.1 hypothetical protein F7D14_17550 [Methylocystis parvus]WBK00517.1 hypothetical protein MMG94_01990 [Methylocystis parvus OBBP]
MKYAMTMFCAILFSGAMACVPAKAHHTGETGDVVREGGHHRNPQHRQMKSHIVREGGYGHHYHHPKPYHGPHWGKHHHHGVHLEGGH